jgi:hypothetical protein
VKPQVDWAGIRRVKWNEHLVRFGFGGLVSVGVALIGNKWGPGIGGLFLGFPAILPASLTLVKQKDGRAGATDDARGSRLGSLGLLAFAVTVALLGIKLRFALALALGFCAWLGTSVALWFAAYGRGTSR